jgi:sialidase-1
MLFSNPHTLPAEPGGRSARENLMIKLSRDGGATWPISRTLDPGRSAYSDLTVLPDGTVICLYEAATGIVAARFNLEWVTAAP